MFVKNKMILSYYVVLIIFLFGGVKLDLNKKSAQRQLKVNEIITLKTELNKTNLFQVSSSDLKAKHWYKIMVHYIGAVCIYLEIICFLAGN